MKHFTFITFLLLYSIIGFTQNDTIKENNKTLIVNGKDINAIKNEYIEIVCFNSLYYGKKWAITFDIGEEFLNWKGHKYQDENKNTIDFKSPMDALNYLAKCGWKYIDQTSQGDSDNVYLYYLMYKNKH